MAEKDKDEKSVEGATPQRSVRGAATSGAGATVTLTPQQQQQLRAQQEQEQAERQLFYVRQGATFGINRLPGGSEVYLTEAEAAPFSDLLEREDRTPMRSKFEDFNLRDESTRPAPGATGFVSAVTTDRREMTPEQRATTSQTEVAAHVPSKGATESVAPTLEGTTIEVPAEDAEKAAKKAKR